MVEPLVIVGAGGFGRETLDVVEAINAASQRPMWTLLGVVDDSPSEVNLNRLKVREVPLLGGVDAVPSDAWVAIAIGAPQTRARLAAELAGRCAGFATLVHPTAVVGSVNRIGEGTIVCAQASIGTNVVLGRHVHLNPHAVIGHDACLDDCVSVNPNATISGECVVQAEVLIGAGATVLQGLHLASGTVVGAAACVVRDVTDPGVIVGVPAQPTRNGRVS